MGNGETGSKQNIDDKGRLIVPVKYRDDLKTTFVITQGLDGCLFVFGMGEWEKLKEKLDEMPISKGRDIQRFFYYNKSEREMDKQGRVLIPVELRQYAGLETEAEIVKLGRRMEIWSKARWESQSRSFMENTDTVAALMEELGI